MIAGYHIIFAAYGFWLPNDPRGSWSTYVGLKKLYAIAGPATTTNDPSSLARKSHDRIERRSAKDALSRPPVRFNDRQIKVIGRGFAEYIRDSTCHVWACAVMPDHVHLVTGTLTMPAERLVIQLKGAATKHLIAQGCHPCPDARDAKDALPKCFVRGQWIEFLEPPMVGRAIRYVQRNPIKQGLPPQRWSFVTNWGG